MAPILDTEEGAVGGETASNVTNSDARKVITLFGVFSRMEHGGLPEDGGPDIIEKSKKITDHIANVREVNERTR